MYAFTSMIIAFISKSPDFIICYITFSSHSSRSQKTAKHTHTAFSLLA